MIASLKSRWVISIALSVTISLCVVGFLTLTISKSKLHEALIQNAEQKLSSQKNLVKQQISSYFYNIEKQLLVMAGSKNTKSAANDFRKSFYQYTNSVVPETNLKSVTEFYNDKFGKRYLNTTKTDANVASFAKELDTVSLALQADYIANNPFALGEKEGLIETGNQTLYNQHHRKYHPDFAAFISAFDFYDLFIVDAARGDVIYSVYKEIDFATNLQNGSFNNSGLAEAYEAGKHLSEGAFFLSDFKSYTPSYEAPAGFISSPIYSGDTIIAVLIFQMPINTIANIMNQNQKWTERGFGNSGEVYLVGDDKTLRSESRFYIESPAKYVEQLESLNIPESKDIEKSGTTITFQKVDSTSSQKALAGQSGFGIVKDYRGVNVLSSYSQIKFGALNWAIIAEIDEEEAFESMYKLDIDLSKVTIFSVLICTFIFTVIAVIMTGKLISPLVVMGKHFDNLTQGEADLTATVPRSTIPEINTISKGFNIFVKQLRIIINDVKSNALTVAAASEQLSVSTHESSNAAKYQQQKSNEVMLAIQDFNTSINEVAGQSQKASEGMTDAQEKTSNDSERAATAANNISELVSEVNSSAQTILQLKDEVQNINDVLVVINGIADQTNLLALNAAIEAARAGEHGRGFSVVADEVRTLASSTQKSTIDIQEKIKSLTTVAEDAVESMARASQSATDGGELVQHVSKGLTDMTLNISSLASINQQVANTSQIQNTTSENISKNMHSVSSASDQLSASSNEAQQAARELSVISNNLQMLVERFKT